MFLPTTRVLIADPVKGMRRILLTALHSHGLWDVTEADNGANALRHFEKGLQDQKAYGLVISEWSLAKVSGIELLKQVRGLQHDIPFFMVTAEAEQNSILQALHAGVSSYLTKPITAVTFTEKLEAAYRRHTPQASAGKVA